MKNDPNKNGMTYASHTLPSLHLFTFLKLFCSIEVCVLLEHVLISYTGGVCYIPMGVGSKLLRGGSPVKACVG